MTANKLGPDELRQEIYDKPQCDINYRTLRECIPAWQADKERIAELEATIKSALGQILQHKAKEVDAPASADMHLSQAIDRLNSTIEYEPKDAERAEHLNYAVELVGMTRPKK